MKATNKRGSVPGTVMGTVALEEVASAAKNLMLPGSEPNKSYRNRPYLWVSDDQLTVGMKVFVDKQYTLTEGEYEYCTTNHVVNGTDQPVILLEIPLLNEQTSSARTRLFKFRLEDKSNIVGIGILRVVLKNPEGNPIGKSTIVLDDPDDVDATGLAN